MSSFALIDEGRVHDVEARVAGGAVRIPAAALERATEWTLKPEGLCRGDVCVPVRDRAGLADDAGVDLARFAAALGRPLALDPEERAAALGTPASERAQSLASLEAPDFELPDLTGALHRLSDHRGRKVLLIAYASW
jgi:hypothetical protein